MIGIFVGVVGLSFYHNVCVYVVFVFTQCDRSCMIFPQMLFSVDCNSSKTRYGHFKWNFLIWNFISKTRAHIQFGCANADEYHSMGQRPWTSLHLSPMSVVKISFCFLFFWSNWNFHLICAVNLQCIPYIWLCLFHFPSNLEGSSWVVNILRSNVAFSLNLIHEILHLIDFAYMLMRLFVFLAVWQPDSFLYFSLLFILSHQFSKLNRSNGRFNP